jgi:hypothetical protein
VVSKPVVTRSTLMMFISLQHREFHRQLKKIYSEWSIYDDRCGLSMDIGAFTRLMSVSTIATTEDQQKLVNNAFWGSQFNPMMAWEVDALCYTEFLEALQYLISRTVEGSRSVVSN